MRLQKETLWEALWSRIANQKGFAVDQGIAETLQSIATVKVIEDNGVVSVVLEKDFPEWAASKLRSAESTAESLEKRTLEFRAKVLELNELMEKFNS